MTRRTLSRGAMFVAMGTLVAAGLANACLYGVPDVLPEPPEAAFVPFEGGGTIDQLVPKPGIDSSIPDACVGCTQTVVAAVVGRLATFTLDPVNNYALLGVVEPSPATGSAIERLTLPSGAQIMQTPLVIARSTSLVKTITTVTTDGRVIYLAGTTLMSVGVAGGTPTAVPVADAGVFTPAFLAATVDDANQSIYVGSSASPSELRRIGYLNGSSDVLGSVASLRSLRYSQGGLYYFGGAALGGGLYPLGRVDVTTKLTSSGPQAFDVLAFPPSVVVAATNAQILRLTPGSLAAEAVIAPANGSTITALAAIANPGTAGLTAYWSDSPGTGLVRRASQTLTTSTLPAIQTPDGPLDILALSVRGTDLYAAGNAGLRAYVVHIGRGSQ